MNEGEGVIHDKNSYIYKDEKKHKDKQVECSVWILNTETVKLVLSDSPFFIHTFTLLFEDTPTS